jgi:hypothetical protein
MKLATTLLLLIYFSSGWSNDKTQPVMMYKVISDKLSESVPEGKCLITGTVTKNGVAIEDAHVFGSKSDNVKTSKNGKFRILIDTSETYLVIHKLNLPETYVEFYKFKNKHHIEIEVYIPEFDEMIMVDKPVIYLYGSEKQNAKIKIKPKGAFTFTYPLIGSNNIWDATISDKGIIVGNKIFPYLFYETKMQDLTFTNCDDILEGSVVSKLEVISFLEESLTKLNLNSNEKTDFITYWAPKMILHEKMFVQFWTEKQYDRIATIKVHPQPENMLRVFMVYAPIENGIVIESSPQQLHPVNRNGFTVIEWGGSELSRQKLYITKTL